MNRLTLPGPRAALAVALAVVLTGLVALLSACGASSGNADAVRPDGSVDLSKVTLVVGDQKGGSQSLLQAAGLDDTPYTVDYKEFTSGPPLLEALNAGAVDAGGVGNTPPLFAAAAGDEFKVVQAASYGGSGDAILVPQGSPITSVAQLKGHSVAVAQGSSANYNLLAQLQKAGLGYSDVDVQNLQPADALAAFSSGHVDAWAIWEPYTSQAIAQTHATVLADGSDGVTNGYTFQVASDKALADPATAAALQDFLQRIAEAQRWSQTHQQQWADTWAQATGLDPTVTLAAVDNRQVATVPVDQTVVDSEQAMADAFHSSGLIPSQVDVANWFDGRYNDVTSGAASTTPSASPSSSPSAATTGDAAGTTGGRR